MYTLCFSNGDNDDDLEIEVEGDYQPEEPMEWGYSGGYPGCPEQFEITEIRIKDTQAEICLLDENDEIDLSEQVIDKMRRGY